MFTIVGTPTTIKSEDNRFKDLLDRSATTNMNWGDNPPMIAIHHTNINTNKPGMLLIDTNICCYARIASSFSVTKAAFTQTY